MASVSDTFIAHCLELLRPMGEVHARRLFSGFGLYLDAACLAIAVHETLYLKVDEATRADFQAGGGHQFAYPRAGKPAVMSFWTVPPDAMESPLLMLPWARLALAAALRTRAAKPVRQPPRIASPGRR